MEKKLNGILLPALLCFPFCLFIIAGCGDDGNPTNTPVTAVGTWKGPALDTVSNVVIKADNTFSMDLPGTYGIYSLTGTYALSGNTITFTFTSAAQSGLGIPLPDTNPLAVAISGNQMTFPVPYLYENGKTVTV